MSVKSRLSWMVSGPARLDEMQRSIVALQQQVADMQARQDEQLADVRASVGVVLDDVTARLAALDERTPTVTSVPGTDVTNDAS